MHLVWKQIFRLKVLFLWLSACLPDFSASEICFSPIDGGSCSGAFRRFAFNPETKRCQSFTFSGCGGNQNNFLLRKHCYHKCIRGQKGKDPKHTRRSPLPLLLLIFTAWFCFRLQEGDDPNKEEKPPQHREPRGLNTALCGTPLLIYICIYLCIIASSLFSSENLLFNSELFILDSLWWTILCKSLESFLRSSEQERRGCLKL